MTSPEAGYSLPLVLVIALVLIGGASALVARSSSGVLGGIFQKQSLEARGLAELGMATLVSRLNKEENRYLMAAPAKDLAPNYSREALWSNDSSVLAANHTNPCAYTRTDLGVKVPIRPQISDIYPTGDANGWWFVDADGRVSTSQANAIGKFRLIGNSPLQPGGNFKLGIIRDGSEELNISKPDGKSSIKLSVEAVALNANGSDKARAVLEQVLDLVPKCCRTTFGNDHGNNNYRTAYDPNDNNPNNAFGAGLCDVGIKADSFGIVYGISGTGGLLKTTGNATEVWRREEDGSQTMINPVACIQLSSINPCQIDGTFNGISGSNTAQLLEVLNTPIPKAPEWYPGKLSAAPMPAFLPLGVRTTSGSQDSVCNNVSNTPTNPDCLNLNNLPGNLNTAANKNPQTTPFFRYCIISSGASCDTTYINGNARDEYLPPQCMRTPPPPTGDGALHCVVSQIKLGVGGKKLQFVTGGIPPGDTIPTIRPIRLYFPVASGSTGNNQPTYLIDQTGGAEIQHCVEATPSTNASQCLGTNNNFKEKISQLSMFGCNRGSNYYGVPCGTQYISLQGSASTLGYFSYFPNGNIELRGTADIQGVVWSNNLNSTGSGDFIVPASGVKDVFELMGLNPGINNNFDSSIYGSCPESLLDWPPKWDFVARSVRRFSFKYG
jgi:hypothetical protein